MYAGIRTRSGIIFLSAEISRLEKIKTAVVVSPIPRPLMAVVVVARVGHIPNIRTKVGFSLMIPLYKRSIYLFMLPTSYCATQLLTKYSAVFTAFVTALDVMVAPLMASISSSEAAPDFVTENFSTFLSANWPFQSGLASF